MCLVSIAALAQALSVLDSPTCTGCSGLVILHPLPGGKSRTLESVPFTRAKDNLFSPNRYSS
jgi:hypothetical protein